MVTGNMMKKRQNIRNKRLREEDKTASEQLRTVLKDEVNKFEKEFENSDICQESLEKSLGWRKNGKPLKSIDHRCKGKKQSGKPCDSEYYHLEDNMMEDVVTELKFRCSKCGNGITAFTETIIKRKKTGYWIWFFSLYCMMLLEGKRPVTYLTS